jgi:DHA2 family multidrug resistance protein
MASTPPLPPASPLSRSLTPFQRNMIMAGAMVGAFMQVLDTTIANVAVPHMQTSVSATPETITWVLTSYIVASAIAIPMTGWLADRIGAKQLFVLSTCAFTVASALCAIATNLPEIVTFRIIQGIGGAFILPVSQAIILDVNPPENAARAMTIFSAGGLIGPVMGPVLGGWLTDNFNWRWVFLINVPFGILCVIVLMRFLPRSEKTKRRFDLFGFASFALALGALQMMLDRGNQLEWFESWEVCIEIGLVVGAGWMFVVHLCTDREPMFERAMFADRNFVASVLFSLLIGVVIIGGGALIPPMLQRLMGYTVLDSGMMAAPRGIGSFIAMLIVARLINRIDPRVLMIVGMGIAAVSLWSMSGFNLQMDSRPMIVANFLQGLGMGLTYVPITIIAFATIGYQLRTAAASLLTLARSVGGSIGISITTTVLARSIQISHADLASQITPASTPAVDPGLLSMAGSGGETVMAMLDAEINRQAAMIGYVNDFYMMMIAILLSLPLILLLRFPRQAQAAEQPVPAE